MGFIDTMRSQGFAVESICRVLHEQGCQIAARTYRSWKRARRVIAARTLSDALVVDAVRDTAWTTTVGSDGAIGRKLSPEGLYGRREMTAYLRRTTTPEASAGSVDRAMRTLGLSGVRRDRGIRTTIPAKDGSGPGICSIATSLLRRPTEPGSPTSPMSGPGRGSPMWRSSSMSTPSGSWPGTPRRPCRRTW